MLQNNSREVSECLRHAEECRRLAEAALIETTKTDYLEMEQRWLNLACSYEFSERLSRFTTTASGERKPAK